MAPEDLSQFLEFRRWGRDFTGYEGLSVSGLDAVFDNLMNGTAMITSRGGWKWDDIIFDLGMRLSDIAHQDMVVLCKTTEDIVNAKKNGQIAFIVSIEGAAMIENELDRLDILYGLGVRCLGIAYSEGNALGGGLKEPRDGGLTMFGRQAVRRMNQLGIAIDVSHSGDQTSLDTIEVSDKPVFITHAGARALWNSNRLKPDDVIKACADKGGVIGIEAAPHTTLTEKHPRHSYRVVHGALRILRQSGRHRPCGLRPRRPVRRPCGAAQRADRRAVDRRFARPPSATRKSSTWTASRAPPRPFPTSCAGW